MAWGQVVFLVCLAVLSTQGLELERKSKNPRLFWTTTTQSYTSKTLSTTTWCFRSSATLATTACTGRRKRRVLIDPAAQLEGLEITPTNINEPDNKKEEIDIEDGIDDSQDAIDEEAEREARFLQFYFFTTTLTSTTTVATSYTSTSTVASLICTPSGFFLKVCQIMFKTDQIELDILSLRDSVISCCKGLLSNI